MIGLNYITGFSVLLGFDAVFSLYSNVNHYAMGEFCLYIPLAFSSRGKPAQYSHGISNQLEGQQHEDRVQKTSAYFRTVPDQGVRSPGKCINFKRDPLF